MSAWLEQAQALPTVEACRYLSELGIQLWMPQDAEPLVPSELALEESTVTAATGNQSVPVVGNRKLSFRSAVTEDKDLGRGSSASHVPVTEEKTDLPADLGVAVSSESDVVARTNRQTVSAAGQLPSVLETPKATIQQELTSRDRSSLTSGTVNVSESTDVATSSTSEQTFLKFGLIVQPLSAQVLLLCEQADVDATCPSQQEYIQLERLLVAAGRLVNQNITVSNTFFNWPVVSYRNETAEQQAVSARQALLGLIAGQAARGVSNIIVLGSELQQLNLKINDVAIHYCRSLQAMLSGDREAKKVLWQLLQKLL